MSQPSIVSALRADLANPNVRGQLQAALPSHVSVDKFARVVLTAVQSNYMLVQADRTSLLKSCMEAAADGLLPDGREGAIVPYRRKGGAIEAQWQPMVWGLVKLVRQSGELLDIGTEIIRQGDEFQRWFDESGPHFKHVPALSGEGSPVGVYAYARTKDGGFYIEYMPWSEVEKFKALSKAKSDEGPWSMWGDEMAKIRPLKRLCKRLPMSTDALEAINRDNAREAKLVEATVSPIAAMNAQITGTDTPKLEASNAQTLETGAAIGEAAYTIESNGPEIANQTSVLPADPGKPTVTYAAVMDSLTKAAKKKDVDLLDAAASLIEEVGDATQRDELSTQYHAMREKLAA